MSDPVLLSPALSTDYFQCMIKRSYAAIAKKYRESDELFDKDEVLKKAKQAFKSYFLRKYRKEVLVILKQFGFPTAIATLIQSQSHFKTFTLHCTLQIPKLHLAFQNKLKELCR